MPSSHPRWICCQLGSREHYAIPRALHQEGRLQLLLTDFWCRNPGALKAVPLTPVRKMAERRHDDLNTARVRHIGWRRVLFDLRARQQKWSAWETIVRRNEWFQHALLEQLKEDLIPELRRQPPGIFFAYSYAARHLLQFFRERGWRTVLGQIDPGIEEENLVARELAEHQELATSWERAPREYWDRWREESELADCIAVNSEWSKRALVQVGIPDEKVTVLPLAYERPAQPVTPRDYPSAFTGDRPMRVLFLGQITARKGIRFIFEAAERLRHRPVEFWMVGPRDLEIPRRYLDSSRFHWMSAVSGSETKRLYAEADVFLLPTLSDGFALTQLEAQAQKLPIIASRFCGEVVKDGHNGFLLDPLSGENLAAILERLLENPALLPRLERESGIDDCFSLARLTKNLLPLAAESPPPASLAQSRFSR